MEYISTWPGKTEICVQFVKFYTTTIILLLIWRQKTICVNIRTGIAVWLGGVGRTWSANEGGGGRPEERMGLSFY